MPNWLLRTVTSLLIGAFYILFYLYVPPWLCALAIACIGLYAVCCELLPLLCKSYNAFFALSAVLYVCMPFTLLVAWASAFDMQFLVACAVACSSAADIGAYVVGNLCGTHKLIPAISPHKTWEGFLGGWATVSIMLGGAYAVWGNSVAWISCVYQCCFFIIFGGGIAVAGLCGDLYISLLKRRAGVKDTGNLLPGHGGLLDRLDSILAVTLYIWWYKTTLLALFG